ncbi:MAG: hypothetical protein RDV48_15155 [Candidatus Eremiobacteraeota bacterium]|nr:hypothetical protein [Candidatus Eremiobacteraeota bacterium]
MEKKPPDYLKSALFVIPFLVLLIFFSRVRQKEQVPVEPPRTAHSPVQAISVATPLVHPSKKSPSQQVLPVDLPPHLKKSPSSREERDSRDLLFCQVNCRQISEALELYSSDYKGRYPLELGGLVPAYLKAVPSCPSQGKDTYSGSYEVSTMPDFYSFCCMGKNHAAVPSDYPRADARSGYPLLPEESSKYALERALLLSQITEALGREPSPREKEAYTDYYLCQRNCRHLATAIEMYSTDNRGHCPPGLAILCPRYLKSIPLCPAAGKDTYRSSYEASASQDFYTIYCRGASHRSIGAAKNTPVYNATGNLFLLPQAMERFRADRKP